jgi:hypothetical protein
MFWINAISTDASPQERCFVFDSFTIAQIIADKLEREGFIAQILDQEFQAVTKIPQDPFRRFLGIHRSASRPAPNAWTLEIP